MSLVAKLLAPSHVLLDLQVEEHVRRGEQLGDEAHILFS